MRSPFPGMDPYLEQFWGDLHHRLCTYACDALQPQVEPHLMAWLGERVVVAHDEGPRTIIPDVRVAGPKRGTALAPGSAVSEHEPLLIRFIGSESAHQAFVEIVDPLEGNRLITVIEFLSATNKWPGKGERLYRRKQQECRDAGVSLVEINLLRDGPWVLQVPIRRVPPDHREPYAACVHRGWTDDVYEFYAMPITGPLQKVRIPLRKGDADALLDLQALLDEAYAKSPSRRAIDYTVDAHPPLTGDAEVWADDLLRKAGRRPAVT